MSDFDPFRGDGPPVQVADGAALDRTAHAAVELWNVRSSDGVTPAAVHNVDL
jgi:hypothetical protein